MKQNFWYKEFDINHLLPLNWREDITDVTKQYYKNKALKPFSVTSRESSEIDEITVATVGGQVIIEKLPWLKDLYEIVFLKYGKEILDKEVYIAKDERYAININYQYGQDMRYECHVDSNPLEGLLYVTTHEEGAGGELVIGLNCNAKSLEEVNENCIRIYPKSGYLVFFDARAFPHYVTSLKNKEDFRIVVAMNFYTDECTESSRPSDLNKHLGIE